MKKIVLCGLILCFLNGCGTPSMQDVMTKSKDIKKKDELQSVLGKPDKYEAAQLPMIGSTETWTYICSDGNVVFTIANDKVFMRVAGKDGKRNRQQQQ